MNEQSRHHHNQYENTGLFSLILAYFFPIYFNAAGKADIHIHMVTAYASRYMLRSTIGALLTFVLGEILIRADQIIIGETVTVLFVIFTGLCSVFLCAMVEARKTN